jgi:hypothetical protein
LHSVGDVMSRKGFQAAFSYFWLAIYSQKAKLKVNSPKIKCFLRFFNNQKFYQICTHGSSRLAKNIEACFKCFAFILYIVAKSGQILVWMICHKNWHCNLAPGVPSGELFSMATEPGGQGFPLGQDPDLPQGCQGLQQVG